MKNYTFEQIKETVLKWSHSYLSNQLAASYCFEITKNEEDVLLIDLTFEYCLAQIVVSNPIFAPYQYVSLEAMAFDFQRSQEPGKEEMIYFFYDSADMMENEVLEELSLGIKLCSDYLPAIDGGNRINEIMQNLLNERRNKHIEDYIGIQRCWDKMINILSNNEKDTLIYLQQCSKEDLYYLSEVFEDISEKLHSKKYIECLRKIDKKYPELEMTNDIDIAEEYL